MKIRHFLPGRMLAMTPANGSALTLQTFRGSDQPDGSRLTDVRYPRCLMKAYSEYPGVEEWRPAVGWEGLYEVSDLGRVKSLDRYISAQGRRYSCRLLKPGNDGRYLFVILRKDGVSTNRKVHRLVLEAFEGPRPSGMEALHGPGGVHDNCWPESLHWGTRLENVRDLVRDRTAWWIYSKQNPVTGKREPRCGLDTTITYTRPAAGKTR